MRHGKGTMPSDLIPKITRIGQILNLNTAIPIVSGNAFIALHHISMYISHAINFALEHTATRLRFQNPVTDGFIHRSYRSWLVVIVNDVVLGGIIPSIHGTVPPIKEHVVHKIKNSVPTNGRIPSGVVGVKVAHKRAIFSSQGGTKGVVPGIQGLRKNGVLDGNILGTQFKVGLTSTVVPHMSVKRHVFVKAPAGRNVVHHDITNSISSKRIVASSHPGVAPAKA